MLFSLAVNQRPGGTLSWMAPEYFHEDKFTMTTAVDIWAFGMTALASHSITLLLMLSNAVSLGAVYQEVSIRSSEE